MEIIVILIIGGAAGWLGSMIYTGSGLGILGNIVVGIIGSMVGYWLLGKLGISGLEPSSQVLLEQSLYCCCLI